MQGYTFKCINRENCYRKSGGVGVLIKDSLYKDIVFLDNSTENVLWFKLKNNNCIFGIVYIPPESSSYSSMDIFEHLERSILDFNDKVDDCSFCIFGDFNARSGCLPDFVHIDKYIADENFDNVTKQIVCKNNLLDLGFPIEHTSKDNLLNNYGYRLVELCNFVELYFANGRCGADAYIGKSTCTSGSVIDYTLLSGINFPKLRHFDVMDFDPLLSDVHSVIEVCIMLSENIDNHVIESDSVVDEFSVLNKPTWVKNLSDDYKESFDEKIIDDLTIELDNLYDSKNYNDDIINSVTDKVSNIMLNAAINCDLVKQKRIYNNYKPKKVINKPWFDESCRNLRSRYMSSRIIFRRNRSKANQDEMISNSKKYKKEINKKFKFFKSEIVLKLKKLKKSDPKAHWSLLNKYSSEKPKIINKSLVKCTF